MAGNKEFKIIEDYNNPNVDLISSMLKGESPYPIYIVRNYLNTETCEELIKKFYQIIEKTNGGNRQDFVPVLQIGATQFNKSTSEYFLECQKTKPYVDEILNSITNFSLKENLFLDKTLSKLFRNKNIEYGSSSYKNHYVNKFTIRKWMNKKSELLLLPHEDLSQLKVAKKDNYEISEVKKVIACNLCVTNSSQSQFIIWNIEPNEQMKIELGIENKGYPYPVELLENIESLTFNTKSGDLYFINANLIHAVKEVENGDRITLGRFIGFCSKNKVVYWT